MFVGAYDVFCERRWPRLTRSVCKYWVVAEEREHQKLAWRVRYWRKHFQRRRDAMFVEWPTSDPLGRALWVCSWQRSGSTWLAEMLAQQRGTRLVYEPANVPDGVFSGEMSSEKELPMEGDPATFAIIRALRGVERGEWVDQMPGAHLVRRRVVKDVRGVGIAPSVREKCPNTPVVFLTRHPIAVARSKVALGWTSPAGVSDAFAHEIQQWCQVHTATLRDERLSNVHFVTYEAVRDEPRARVEAIRDYALTFNSTWRGLDVNAMDPGRPSSTNFRNTDVVASEGWGDLDRALVHRAAEILGDYGFDAIYNDRPGAQCDLDTFVHHLRAAAH